MGVRAWMLEQLEDFQPTYRITVCAPGVALLPRITQLLHPGLFRERFGPTLFHSYDVSMLYDPVVGTFRTEGRAFVQEDFEDRFTLFRAGRKNSIIYGAGAIREGNNGSDHIEVEYNVARPFQEIKRINALYSFAVGGCAGIAAGSLFSNPDFARAPLVVLFSSLVFFLAIRASRKRRIDLIAAFHFAFKDAVATAVAEQKQQTSVSTSV